MPKIACVLKHPRIPVGVFLRVIPHFPRHPGEKRTSSRISPVIPPPQFVIPRKRGISLLSSKAEEIPACAGMTFFFRRDDGFLCGMTNKKLANTQNTYNIKHMEKSGGFVYIMTNKKNGTLYIGSTSDLIGRVFEHKNKLIPKSFTARYNLDKLVYFEYHNRLDNMVIRERQMKEWNRVWKIQLIEKMNPDWNDLYNKLLIETGYEPVNG